VEIQGQKGWLNPGRLRQLHAKRRGIPVVTASLGIATRLSRGPAKDVVGKNLLICVKADPSSGCIE
jgi:hypothetical protein